MKRFFMFVAMLATATSCFAYYGDYSSSSNSGWLTFLGIVLLIWGVLQIILFFKVWGMTNDIKALKKDHFNEGTFETNTSLARYLRKNLVLGNMDNVKRILLQDFIDNVESAYGELRAYGYVTDDEGNEKYVSLKEQNLKESIRPYVENLQKQFDKIGEELPVYIQRMETFGDYYSLFTKEDLVVNIEKEESQEK